MLFLIYASNEPKSVLARDLATAAITSKLAGVFLIVHVENAARPMLA